jgi:ABC-type dipeptide/oligopeptide/nickel transport system permease component
MKVRKLSILCLYMSLACSIPMLILLFTASNRQMGSTIGWFHLMECVMPSLIFGLALTFYFINKARAALSFK